MRSRVVGLALIAALVALVVTSVGWYRSADAGGGSRFDSCSFDGTTLALTWTYGVESLVSPTVDTRSGRIVVALRDFPAGGPRIAIALSGEARFRIMGASPPVTYADGSPLACPRPAHG
jgi:hypothetical protein